MIYIENRQNKIDITEEFDDFLKVVIEGALKEEEVEIDCEISILLVDNEEIRELNRQYRNIDRETDVLSFPMLNYPNNKVYRDVYSKVKFDATYMDNDELVLGDIVLSLEKAEEQRIDYGHSFKREVAYLTVHSILHLLGYDHMEEGQKDVMREREEYILNKLDIRRE